MNVVGAVLIQGDEIILTKRSLQLPKYPGFYEFPGGKVEFGETLKEALKRELFEELSIDVDINDIQDFDNNVLKTDKLVLTIFIIKKWKKNIIINPEINSHILYIKINEFVSFVNDDFNGLTNDGKLLETDKQLIPAILSAL